MAVRPIDEKLVVMRMQNDDFKNKAAETTSIFGKLKQSLSNIGNTKLDKVAGEFGNIQKSVDKVSMNPISTAIDTISSRFTTLGVIATTALTNITNKAVDAGMRIADSLGPQQMRAGFEEYETKMGSIQTILANTGRHGTTLDDVSNSLNELNEYADQTIYSFSDMTKNIGLFTNAGLKLEESTSMIKGFSNAAAASGTNAEGAARAAYQLSQGLSSGYIMQMDWMSLTNAGMGNDNMKRDLIAIGQAMGTINKPTETVIGNWKELLSEDKWLTSDVMSTYLQAMAGDLDKATLMTQGLTEAQADMLIQNAKVGLESATFVRTFTGLMGGLRESIGSGWATTFEVIFGDFEQATVLWTSISNLITPFFQKQADARNEMLRELANNGVLEKFGLIIKNVITPIIQIFKSVGNAFREAFPPMGTDGLMRLVSTIESLTSKLKMSESTVQNVTTIFKGLFSVFGIIGSVIKILVSSVAGLFPSFDSAGGGILSFIAKLAQMPITINQYLKSGQAVEKVTNGLKTIFSGLGTVIGVIGNAFTGLASVVAQTGSIFSKGTFTEGAIKDDSLIVSALLGIRNAFEWTFDTIASIDYAGIWGGFKLFFDGVGNVFVWIKDAGAGILNFFKGLGPGIANNQGWILAGGGLATMAAVIWKAYETFKSVTQPFKSFSNLLESGAGALDNLGDVLDGASSALKAFTLGIHVKSILTIAVAVGILAVSLKLLSDLNTQQITNGLYMIVGSLTAVVGALVVMSKWGGGGTLGATLTIVAISVAVSILAGAVKKMSDMNYDEMTRGLLGLVTILATLTGAIVLMSAFGSTMTVGAMQFLAIAAAIHILLMAVDSIAEMKPDVIQKGLVTLGILLLELALFIQIASSKNKQFTTSAAGILATAGAIWIIVQAMENIAEINGADIAKGLITVGLLLTMIAAFGVVSSGKGLLSTGAGLLVIAGALAALLPSIIILGNTPLSVLATGIIAMGAALAVLGLAAKLMTTSIPGAIAITILAVAMNLLIIPIAALGAMSWGVILTGIGALTLALIAIGGTAAILGMATLPMLGFGIALLAIGAGLTLLGKGLLIFTTLTVGAVTVIVTALASFITGFVTLLPAITDLLLKITNAIVEVMVKMTPKIVDAIGRLIMALLLKIKQYVPIFIDIVADTLMLILDKLGEFVVKAVRVVLDLMLELMDTISAYIPKFIEVSTNMILAFLQGLTDNIPKIIDAVAVFMVTMVTTMADTIEENGPLFINAVMKLMAEIVTIIIEAGISTINALFGWIPGVKDATEKIGKTAGKYIEENFKAVDIGTAKGVEFTAGLEGTIPGVKTAGEAIAKAGVAGMSSVDTSTAGANFGNGFANGINKSSVGVRKSSKDLALMASGTVNKTLDMHSPSRVMDASGQNAGAGFANGIAKKEKSVMEAVFGWLPGMEKGTVAATKKAETGGEKVGESGVKGITKGVKKTAKKTTKETTKVVKDMAGDASKAFKEKMEEAEYKFKMGEIDSAGHIAEITKIRDSYSKYRDLVRDANLEIKKIEEDVVKKREELRKQEFSDSKSWIDERKFYNEMSLADELAAWTRVMNKYKEGTEQRKEAERQVYTLKNELKDKMITLNEEYLGKIKEINQKEIDGVKTLVEAYDDALESRTNSLASFVGIFDEVKKASEISGQTLIDNLKGQVATFASWSENIRTLANKGIDEGLLETLRQMGPQAAGEIAALNTLTESQLSEYSELWKTKNKLAREQAMAELEPLRNETVAKIEALRSETNAQLSLYVVEWQNKMVELRNGTTNEFVQLSTSMQQIGTDAIAGLMNGMKAMEGPLIAQAQALAAVISQTIQGVLDMHSPSRVLKSDGENAGEGLAIGIANKVKRVKQEAKNLATAAKDSVNKFLEGLQLPEDDNTVYIKAVIEYDGFDLNKLGSVSLPIKPDVSYANGSVAAIQDSKRQNDNNNRTEVGTKPTQITNEYNIDQKLEFHSKQLTPSEVARKNLQASRQLAMQWEG